MAARPLFVRWSVLTMTAGTLLGLLIWRFHDRVHGAPLAVAAVVLALTVAACAYTGLLAWQMDDCTRGWPARRARISHDAERVTLAVYLCQVLAAVGAMIGVFLTVDSHTSTAAEAARHVTGAMANGLAATITGVLCSLLLVVEHHVVVHQAERP